MQAHATRRKCAPLLRFCNHDLCFPRFSEGSTPLWFQAFPPVFGGGFFTSAQSIDVHHFLSFMGAMGMEIALMGSNAVLRISMDVICLSSVNR